MELLVNDLSVHGQFRDPASFREAVASLMMIRGVARQYGRELYCNRLLLDSQATPHHSLRQILGTLRRDEQRALGQWLTRGGPFWEDVRKHGPGDWIECRGELVTDTALGEAAFCCSNGLERHLVSFSPSDWEEHPLAVVLVSDEERRDTVEVANHWRVEATRVALEASPRPLEDWRELASRATERFSRLTFTPRTFEPLEGHPFSRGAAERLLFLLRILDELKSCFDAEGNRTARGHEIAREFFTGKKGEGGRGALFSDSSDTEKHRYKSMLTFEHPALEGRPLFCPWHGKVQTPQLRIHFSWPIRAEEPLYVVYVGPKITRR